MIKCEDPIVTDTMLSEVKEEEVNEEPEIIVLERPNHTGKSKPRMTDASKAMKRNEARRARYVDKYMLEFFTRVTTVPSDALIQEIAKKVDKTFDEVKTWFQEKSLFDAFSASLERVSRLQPIAGLVDRRVELEQIYIQISENTKSLQSMKQEIEEFSKRANLKAEEVTAWLAVQENYREAKKKDLLSMSIPIYTRRADFAAKHLYGYPAQFIQPLPASEGLHPFYPVLFPIELPLGAPSQPKPRLNDLPPGDRPTVIVQNPTFKLRKANEPSAFTPFKKRSRVKLMPAIPGPTYGTFLHPAHP